MLSLTQYLTFLFGFCLSPFVRFVFIISHTEITEITEISLSSRFLYFLGFSDEIEA